MPSAHKWETTSTTTTVINTGATLANNTLSAAGTEYDNRTNLNTYAWLELDATFSVAPSDAAPTVDVYVTIDHDNGGHASAPVTGGTDVSDQFVMSFPARKVTTAQNKIPWQPIMLPPAKIIFYADNQTGQTMSSGWTVKLHVNNFESQ